MRRPSPPRQRNKRTMYERTSKTKKSDKQTEKTTTQESFKLGEEYSQTVKKNFKSEVIVISSSHHNTSQDFDSKDCDSTASTPKQPKEKEPMKQFPATERKAAKKKIFDILESSSAPPKINDWLGVIEEGQFSRINKILFCKPEEEDDNDFHINFHPSSSIGYEGLNIGFPIPEWMPVCFRPTPRMSLNEVCAYTTAYVFRSDDGEEHGAEILIKTTSNVYGDRNTLKTLMPRRSVDQEIINLVVARANWLIQTLGKRRSVWYLPTAFAQYALERNCTADYVRDLYIDKFLHSNSIVNKIFIPMNDKGLHWYLLVIDFTERKLVWLDSLPCEERYHARRHSILKLVIFLEEILLHPAFNELNLIGHDNLPTNFTLVQPRCLPRQRVGSNDCGVWVSKWMIECPYSTNYENVTVVTASRLKLALYLCHSTNNVWLQQLLSKCAQYWSDMEKKRKDLVKA